MDVLRLNWKVILCVLLSFFLSCQGAPYPVPPNEDWFAQGQTTIENALKRKFNTNVAKNVILFIGDGMDITTITAARIYEGQKKGFAGDENQLAFDTFPNVAFSKTYSADRQGSDSTATATAMMSGYKTNSGTGGVSKNVQQGDCSSVADNKLDSMIDLSHKEGKSTGIVTQSRVTHATPAAAYAHTPDRAFEATVEENKVPVIEPEKCTDAAQQLVRDKSFINVILGGGRRAFYPQGTPDMEEPTQFSKRKDDFNLVQEWIDDKVNKGVSHAYVWNQTEFDSVSASNTDYLLGLFDSSHMVYELDRADDIAGQPSIVEMTQKAIEILSKNEKGYFLMVEGARIDHGHHDGYAQKALDDTVMMDKAVKKAVDITNEEDTLIVVTSDHGHVFTMGGYSVRGTPIFGYPTINQNYDPPLDDLPYPVLYYANGPGATNPRQNLTGVDLEDKETVWPGGIPVDYETHGSQDVGIYAQGPMAHLFHSTHEQNYIAHVMMYASCVGPNKKHCEEKKNDDDDDKVCVCNDAKNKRQSISLVMLTLIVGTLKL